MPSHQATTCDNTTATASRLDLELPAGWSQERLCNVTDLRTSNVDKKSADGEQAVKLCNYVDVYYHDKIRSGIAFMDATATTAQIENFTLRKGDVVITKDSETPDDIGIPALVAKDIPDLVCGYHLTILRAFPDVMIGEYLFYALSSQISAYQFYLASNGVTRFGLTSQGTKNLKISYPDDKKCQKTIADFLDWKTGQIDALIAKKKELLDKLKEKRVAVITQAVTRGLNTTAPLRDPGIPWLDHVPEHWAVKRLKFIFPRLYSGVSVNSDKSPSLDDSTAILKTSCVYGNRFKPEENKRVVETELDRVACRVTKDSLIISRMNTPELVGNCGYVDRDYDYLFLPDRLWIAQFQNHPDAIGKFAWYLVISHVLSSLTGILATGTSDSMKNLTQEAFLDIRVGVPPVPEQADIAAFLDAETEKLDALEEKVLSVLERLNEYRTALITAATTGKIDVRKVKISEPVA
jgi:type I restriction enzyme S subunit